jgi:hypothetical protein
MMDKTAHFLMKFGLAEQFLKLFLKTLLELILLMQLSPILVQQISLNLEE